MKETSKMNHEAQQPVSELQAENAAIQPNVIPPTSKKSNKNLWLNVGLAITVICIGSITCMVLVSIGIGKVMRERAPVQSILQSFMQNMEAKDTESALALFSPRSQYQLSMADLEELTAGKNYKMFEGYESLTLENFNLTAAGNTDPDLPQGTVANVTAVVSYAKGFRGNLIAVLEKVDGEWKIFNFHVVVPPDKSE